MPVTRFEVTLRRPLAGGRAFGDVGRYEELVGRIHFAVDPRPGANRAIPDVALAPRDADGRVACGWQCDLPPGVPGLLRLEAPEALLPDGRRLTGRGDVQLPGAGGGAGVLLS